MAEATQPGSPTPQAAPAAQVTAEPQGLDKVYAEYGIEETAQTFQPQSPQPAQQTQPQQPSAPKFDPFDPNFPAHMQAVSRAAAEAQSALQALHGKHTALERQWHQKAVEADIKQAVSVITEKAGIDAEIAEVALEAKARQDARFLKIWNNRQQNPKAYQAALQAVASEFQQKYTVRQDPQLVENQRAVKASQQQMATTQKPSQQDEWASMSASERQAKVRMLINGGG